MALISYTDNYLNWRLSEGHPTNPERAELAVAKLKSDPRIHVTDVWDDVDNFGVWSSQIGRVHDVDYVENVLLAGRSGEWRGVNRELSTTALRMFGGTQFLVDQYVAGADHRVYFNPQGAKHHAGVASSSGFCVFNDMAAAALRLTDDHGLKVMYLDWDAHHGDGVEDILRGRTDITTISIHESGIFPGTGHMSGEGFVNYPMQGLSTDDDLLAVMEDVCVLIEREAPDVLLLACGADGLDGDPLSSLAYTLDGLEEASHMLGKTLREVGAVAIVGGAGGYQPLTETPEHWARTVKSLTNALEGE